MKKDKEFKKYVPLEAEYDPSLDDDDNKVFFPKKIALMHELLEKYYYPNLKKEPKKPKAKKRTRLQKELLDFFKHDPSEEQLLRLKAFMEDLLTEKTPLETLKTEQELEKAA